MMEKKKDLLQILENYSTSLFQIEYNAFLSNHLAHGVIALYHLGATLPRIKHFIDWYTPRLDENKSPKSASQENKKIRFEVDEIEELKGKRINFNELRDHFSLVLDDKYNGNLGDFVKNEFVKNMDGMHCAALHPLIHIGYGLSIQSKMIVCEGLAYLHFSHMPAQPIPRKPLPGGLQYTIFEALDKLKNNSELRSEVKDRASLHGWMPDISGSFQKEVGILCSLADVSVKIHLLVAHLRYPEWFNVDDCSMNDIKELMDIVLHSALTVYSCSTRRNDFFLLHGVTGAWSLYQILGTMDDPLVAFDSVQYFLATLLSVYVAQGCPDINPRLIEEIPNASMNELAQEAVDKTCDEHVYKLVQICFMLSKNTSEDDKQNLYKVASRCALDNKLSFEG